jgi:hypothetical protein
MPVREDLAIRSREAAAPPYTSKWHPIERRLFSQVNRASRGVMRDIVQTALAALQRVPTQTGLTVMAMVLDQAYEVGRTCSAAFR